MTKEEYEKALNIFCDNKYYVKVKDSKGNHYETLMDHFMHLQFKRIKEVKE